MNTSNIRAILQFQEDKVAVLLDYGLNEQEFLKTCLEEFELDPDEWINFEIIHLKLDCKIKTPQSLRFDDEFLLLRPIKKAQLNIKDVSIADLNEKKDLEVKSEEGIDMSFIWSEKERTNNSVLGEIKSSKEDLEEEEEGLDDKAGYFELYNLDQESEELEKSENQDEKEGESINEGFESDIDELINQDFESRDDLKAKVIINWGINNKVKLNFRTRERTNVKDDIKVSMILCSKKDKFGCPFYLEFKTDEKTKKYQISSFWKGHNHSMEEYESNKSINELILNKIKELMPLAKSNGELTKSINKTFGKNFHQQTIYYQVNKIKDEELGKMTEDAEVFIQMLEVDAKDYDGFYSPKIIENTLEGCCYMSKRMKKLLEYFSGVIIIDASHKTNRFNMPFLDIALVNNYGQTCWCFFSLLPNQKYDSFEWSLQQFKTQLKYSPKVIFSDDEEALRKGIIYFYFI